MPYLFKTLLSMVNMNKINYNCEIECNFATWLRYYHLEEYILYEIVND